MSLRVRSALQVGLLWGNSFVGQFISLVFVISVVRQVGLIQFGQYAICLGIVTLTALVVDLGLGILFTAKIASNEGEAETAKRELNFFRWSCTCILLSTSAIFTLLGFVKPEYFLAICVGAISCLDHTWLLQARSKVRQLVAADLITRASTLFFWLTASLIENSYKTALISVGFGFIARWIYTARASGVKGILPLMPAHPGTLLKTSAPLMFAKLMNLITNQLTPLFFGISTSPAALGLFSSAEKPIRAIQAAANSYSIFALPKLAVRDSKDLSTGVKRHVIAVFAISGLIGAITAVSSPLISYIMIGSVSEEWVSCFLVLALVPVVTSVNNLLTASVVPVIGRTNVNLFSSIAGALMLCTLMGLFSKPFNVIQLAAIVLAVEMTITLCSGIQVIIYLRKPNNLRARRSL